MVGGPIKFEQKEMWKPKAKQQIYHGYTMWPVLGRFGLVSKLVYIYQVGPTIVGQTGFQEGLVRLYDSIVIYICSLDHDYNKVKLEGAANLLSWFIKNTSHPKIILYVRMPLSLDMSTSPTHRQRPHHGHQSLLSRLILYQQCVQATKRNKMGIRVKSN